MKIIAISDSHGLHNQLDLPEGDVLIHAGDVSRSGTIGQLQEFNRWLGTLSFSNIILSPGNHDLVFERNITLAREIMTNCHVLLDEEIVIDGIKFYGSPWQPFFYNWSFNLPRGKELADKWERIPDDTDVLITHGPPLGINDINFEGERCGCEDLLKRINVVRPKIHIFGHIHHGYGKVEISGVTFANVSVCDESYEPNNKPTIIKYSK